MTDTIITKLNTPVRLQYTATVGRKYEAYLRALAQGRLIGGRCAESGRVYVPPRAASPVCGLPTDTLVELGDVGTLTSFCVIRIPFAGQRLVPPYVFGAIVLDGADMPIHHLVSGCALESIRMGLRVKARWRAPEDRTPSLESIEFFEPSGEPDAAFESYQEHL